MLVTGPILAKQEDPLEAYLREKQPMDLDAYIHDKMIEAKSKGYSAGDSFGYGAAQGATVGMGDEIQGVVQALGQKVLPESMGGNDYGKSFRALYKENRDTARDENEAARKAHGGAYLGGEVAGSIAPTVLTGAATGTLAPQAKALTTLQKLKPLLAATGQGAVQGAGYSNADTAGGLASDSALGAGIGAAGYGAGQAVGEMAGRASAVFAGRRAAAAGRAGAQAAEEEPAKVASLVSKYGGLRQTENKAILNMLDRERSGLLDHANLAKLQQLKQSGRVEQAINETAANDLEFLSTRTPEVLAAKQEMQAAQQNLPQAIADRTAELQKPSFGKDAASFVKSYGEPAIAAALAPAGLKIPAALLFARTRAGKALMSRLTRPGNEMALMGAADKTTQTAGALLRQFLQRAVPPAATQSLVSE